MSASSRLTNLFLLTKPRKSKALWSQLLFCWATHLLLYLMMGWVACREIGGFSLTAARELGLGICALMEKNAWGGERAECCCCEFVLGIDMAFAKGEIIVLQFWSEFSIKSTALGSPLWPGREAGEEKQVFRLFFFLPLKFWLPYSYVIFP